MFQSYKIVRSIPNRSGRIYEDFSGASRLYRSGQRQTVRGLNSFGLYLEAGNVQHIARAVFCCVKIAFTPGIRNKTRAPVLVRVTSGIKDIINAVFRDYKILLHIHSFLIVHVKSFGQLVRPGSVVRPTLQIVRLTRSGRSFGWVVRATGDPLRVEAVRGRSVGWCNPQPSDRQPLEPVTLEPLRTVRRSGCRDPESLPEGRTASNKLQKFHYVS